MMVLGHRFVCPTGIRSRCVDKKGDSHGVEELQDVHRQHFLIECILPAQGVFFGLAATDHGPSCPERPIKVETDENGEWVRILY